MTFEIKCGVPLREPMNVSIRGLIQGLESGDRIEQILLAAGIHTPEQIRALKRKAGDDPDTFATLVLRIASARLGIRSPGGRGQRVDPPDARERVPIGDRPVRRRSPSRAGT